MNGKSLLVGEKNFAVERERERENWTKIGRNTIVRVIEMDTTM